MSVDVAPGTVVVYTDVVCAWSTVALQRFDAARSRLGPDHRVRVDHRLYLLEDVNRFAIPMRMLQAEIPVVGPLEPDLGIAPWQGHPGIALHWADAGYPQVDSDDRGVYDDLVRRATDAAS